MNHNIRPIILSLLVILMLPAIARAQSSLEKITQTVEDNPKCETSIYREKRDPETRKVISSELVVYLSDEKLVNRIIEAFRKERHNAISYSVDNSTGRQGTRFYQIEFESKKGEWSSYSIIYYEYHKKWIYSVKTSIYGNPENQTRTKNRTKSRGRKLQSSCTEREPDYIYPNGDGSYTKIYYPHDDDADDNTSDGNDTPLNTRWMLVSSD